MEVKLLSSEKASDGIQSGKWHPPHNATPGLLKPGQW